MVMIDRPRAGSVSRLRWAVVHLRSGGGPGDGSGGPLDAVVVSIEPFHRARLATIVPIATDRGDARYPGEVALGAGESGLTGPSVVLCHQVRTIPLGAISGAPHGHVADPATRAAIRSTLAHHLGLDIPAVVDGARITA
jgi:mRNA-degrading endonuclease toxin of MazEF toxin-antitoxin module